MFGSEKVDVEKIKKEAVADIRHEHTLQIERMEARHEIELNKKQFEIDHLESEKVKKLEDKVATLEKEKAVLEKSVEMLDKITDLNADVIDVKKLVTNLIDKLPEVKITSLSVMGEGSKGK